MSIDQKTYLQKYLAGPSSGDKKKKKKKMIKGKGIKIIDDDLDVSKLRPLDGDELDILDQGEDAPQIAGIIDERPEELRKLDQFTSSKWKVINQDDGFNSKLEIQEIKRDAKEKEKENEVIFGKMYSDSEDEQKKDSDVSPPRKHSKNGNTARSKKPQNNSDSDISPPRKRDPSSPKIRKEKNYDSDVSPPRKKNGKPRKKDFSPKVQKDKNYDSDVSPPRRKGDNEIRKRKKPSRWGSVDRSTQRSPEISKKRKSPSNHEHQSPARKSRRSESPKRSKRKQKDYDSDISPRRKSRKDSPKRKRSLDSDPSPPRKRKSPYKDNIQNNKSNKDKRNRSPDSDLSPPRKNKKSLSPRRKGKRQYDSDSDLSPPRKGDKKSHKRSSDSPPPTNKKMAKTLDGKKAGLQNAVQLREENDALRRREDEVFMKMADEVSGRNAKVVSRKGKRETSEDRQKQKEKAERQKELDEKYKKWSKGLKQIEAQEARVQDFMHEASKPLARHKNDRDLEDNLRQIERDGDPMLQYIREKKRERGELPPEKPSYKGNFPPNRFNIRPGYRWDGVDRSNGYEKKFFENQSKRKAQEEEAYKWSTEDL